MIKIRALGLWVIEVQADQVCSRSTVPELLVVVYAALKVQDQEFKCFQYPDCYRLAVYRVKLLNNRLTVQHKFSPRVSYACLYRLVNRGTPF